jgi:hypothetical protein
MKKILLILIPGALAIGGYYLYRQAFLDERISENGSKFRMEQIQTALAAYKASCGKFPPDLGELSKSDLCPKYKDSEQSKISLVDYWENRFLYSGNDTKYTLRSMGHSWLEATSDVPPLLISRPR